MAAKNMDKEIRVLFVLPKTCTEPSETLDIMQEAFETCKQNVIKVTWIEETKLDGRDLTKTDFVVFQNFEGEAFQKLQESKCARVLGPWCILICVSEGTPIPNYPWPIYNVAMAGCVVSSSHLPKLQKQNIKEKVQLMGGCYTDGLMSGNTHLVTESVKSEKYLLAAESGLKLMVSEWVEAVYSASLTRKVHCDDEEFNKYRCLPFHKLDVCSTGFPNHDMRTEYAKLVVKYGGTFTGSLSITKTDILIVYGENGMQSQKYKVARSNSNISCVTPEWIHDSIEKGYALPENLYTVKKITSTPTKTDEACPDFSMFSAIGDDKNRTSAEETLTPKKMQATFMARAPRISPNKRKHSATEEVAQLIDALDIKRAKRAGQYLDGCSVYVAGFKAEQREKLCKILNLSGATRYDDISDRLTHIIVGDATCPEVKIIKSKNYPISLVSVHWLLDSMENQQAMDEENYLINLHSVHTEQFNSPLGKKGLSLLRSNRTLTSNDLQQDNGLSEAAPTLDAENDLMKQYLVTPKDDDTLLQLLNADSKFNSNPEVESKQSTINSDFTSQTSDFDGGSSQFSVFFQGKKFVIINFNPDESQYIREQIESVSGSVMSRSYKGIPDYVVAPSFLQSPVQVSALEVVNTLWISESIEKGEEIPISYYHQPLVINANKPLKDCILGFSGYTSFERMFLQELTEELGAIFQEQLSRITSKEKNVLKSTHLVCLAPEGKKYRAALKWNLVIVNKDWLLECAKTGNLAPVDRFLVGEATASSVERSPANFGDSTTKTNSTTLRSNRVLTPLNQRAPLNITKTETPNNQRLFKNVETPDSKIKEHTPRPSSVPKASSNFIKTETPVNQRLFKNVETPGACSQVTPVSKIMEEVRRTGLMGTPQPSPMPKSCLDIDTPESPFGAFIRPHLSPKSKKELMRYINRIPAFVPPPEDKTTPLSEVKRRCWKKLLEGYSPESPSSFRSNKTDNFNTDKREENGIERVDNRESKESDEASVASSETENVRFINTKLKQIEDMTNAMGWSSRRGSTIFESTVPQEVGSATVKDSQPNTVGWDYNDSPSKSKMRIFMLSGIENDVRQTLITKIESMGGQVTELSSYDPKSTHLICPKPGRNEKTLACMAAGKWILHISYVDKSVKAGKFLNEEDFEFGNPKSRRNITVQFDKETEARCNACHWWREEVSRRRYGAFNDMRAIVVAQKRENMIRVIEAGEGQVFDIQPPFTQDVQHVTHCLLEVRSVPDFSVYNPLAQQGILCINTLYISEFLYRTNTDVQDAILPAFRKFY